MNWTPQYSKWRHGGWYVDNLRYPTGAVGCVSRNYSDGKWRIACDSTAYPGSPTDTTFANRDDAARGERMRVMEQAIGAMADAFDNINDAELWRVFTCHEVDTIAGVLRTAGKHEARARLLEQHAANDEPGDAHYVEVAT